MLTPRPASSLGDELLVRGGTLVTMNASRAVLEQDLLIRNGRIHSLFSRKQGNEFASKHPKRVVDASNCAVLPGFVQAHVHLCQVLFRGFADDLPLMDWLRTRIWPMEAAHNASSMKASADLGLLEMMLAGTTTILDMGTTHSQDAVFEAMERSGMRGFSGKAMMDLGEGIPAPLQETATESLRASEKLRAKWHGAANGRLRYAYAPRFILSCSEELLRGVAAEARAHPETLIHSHAAEHRGERDEVRRLLGKDDVEALEAWGIVGPQTILAHGVQLTKAQMKRCAQKGTRFVHCPSANMKLASGIADVVEMERAGLVVGLGADGAPCNNRLDPFTELRQASLLAKAKRLDAQSMPAMDALALLTISGAKALGLDQEIGSLEVGKSADLVVVSLDAPHLTPRADLVSQMVYAATPADVRDVFVGGEWVVKQGKHQNLDRAAVLESANEEAPKLRKRALRFGLR